jgi:hypothetical protein
MWLKTTSNGNFHGNTHKTFVNYTLGNAVHENPLMKQMFFNIKYTVQNALTHLLYKSE